MKRMGVEALYRKPNTSRKHAAHKIWPYLLRNRKIDRSNQVWTLDTTYVPMARGFVSIAHAADWAFSLKPVNFSSFQSLGDLIQLVHVQSPQTALFFDISNEFKHADRSRPSTVTAQLFLQFEVVAAGVNVASKADGKRMFAQGSSGSTWILTPVIKDHAGSEYLFKDCAAEAVRWW
jgi:hypothetical protein